MATVLIIDPYPVARRGLRQIVKEELRDVAFGEAGNAKEALLAIAKRPWDIVILDIAMPDRDGFELLQEISRQRPKSKVLVLSAYLESGEGTHCMQLGACGYISKRTSLSELVKAVRNVLAGKKYLRSSTMAGQLAPSTRPIPDTALSARERETLFALAAGRGIGEIAAELSLSIKTVSTYKRRILNKLRLQSTADLVRYVFDNFPDRVRTNVPNRVRTMRGS